MFPWIRSQKEELSISKEKIYLITGKDDAVVPEKNLLILKGSVPGPKNAYVTIQK